MRRDVVKSSAKVRKKIGLNDKNTKKNLKIDVFALFIERKPRTLRLCSTFKKNPKNRIDKS